MISNTRVILWYYSIWRDVILLKSHLLFMVEITENTKDLITSCIIRRLSTKESLDYLMKNKVKISESTYRRYKSEILEMQNALEVYSWGHIQEEQIQKMETKRTVLRECWKLFQNTAKISEKLSILKSIEKISDELPEVVWRVNRYGYEIESRKKFRKRHNILNQEDEIELEKNGQDLCVE